MIFTFDATKPVIIGAIFLVALLWIVISDIKQKIEMLLRRTRK